MRIDQSDLADESGDTRMARRPWSAPDNPDAAGKDQGEASRSDDLPDSSSAPLASDLRAERATAYRAAVDEVYRQYANHHGCARVQEPGHEAVTPAMRHPQADNPERHPVAVENRPKGTDRPSEAAKLENLQIHDGMTAVAAQLTSGDAHHSIAETRPTLARNAKDPGYPTIGTASDKVQTGAKGLASGREFDPESAGGPVQQLDAGTARITSEGVQEAAAHLRRFTGGGSLEAPEQVMLDRLTSIATGDMEPTSYDLNFYTHELDEAARYAKLGFGPESGVDLGSPTMYDVWNDVHTAALEDYRISGADLFYPGVGP